jgi:hypothetical protein
MGAIVACSLMAAKKSMGLAWRRAAAAGVLWRSLVIGARRAAQFGEDYLEMAMRTFLTDNAKAYSHRAGILSPALRRTMAGQLGRGEQLRKR